MIIGIAGNLFGRIAAIGCRLAVKFGLRIAIIICILQIIIHLNIIIIISPVTSNIYIRTIIRQQSLSDSKDL